MLDKFKELFCGLDVAYGEYYLNGERDNKTGKEKGRATTKRGPVTDELFQRHINGEINLGIINRNDQFRDMHLEFNNWINGKGIFRSTLKDHLKLAINLSNENKKIN